MTREQRRSHRSRSLRHSSLAESALSSHDPRVFVVGQEEEHDGGESATDSMDVAAVCFWCHEDGHFQRECELFRAAKKSQNLDPDAPIPGRPERTGRKQTSAGGQGTPRFDVRAIETQVAAVTFPSAAVSRKVAYAEVDKVREFHSDLPPSSVGVVPESAAVRALDDHTKATSHLTTQVTSAFSRLETMMAKLESKLVTPVAKEAPKLDVKIKCPKCGLWKREGHAKHCKGDGESFAFVQQEERTSC